ncbi:MAG TPA: diguanylate cyclase [Candidatus Hydrogenedentes bacterium]|nr:diguanylate cyclase [Candidatus Hydrogenedentota bacterium]HNT86652.1 diguanylate cyclase [Candidatus Hydrogenedentota bacterium]
MATTETDRATVLVIEQDAATRNVIRDYLGRARFNVRIAINGWEALKRMRENVVHLVICQHDSEDVDGSGIREKFLLNPETRDIPFLFLVPEDQPEEQVRALRSGVDDCIETPFDPVVLVARVQAVVERRDSYLRMVRIDPLTRLLNLPTLLDVVREELKRIERYKRHGCLLLLDLDGFAEINAGHGVEMGDLLLTCLAGVILTRIRSVDIAGRFAGQRFLVYLPETDAAGACRLAERIKERFAIVGDGIAGIRVSFSGGVVEAPVHGGAIDELLARAEEALQRAKEQAKGTAVTWSNDLAAPPQAV